MVLCAVLLLSVVPAHAQREKVPADYIVFKLTTAGDPVPRFYRRVMVAVPVEGKTAEQLLALRREMRHGEELLEFHLSDSFGRVVFQDAVRVSRELRGEFHREPQGGGAWDIDGHFFRDPEPVFVLRVPAVPGASLRFVGSAREFVMDRMADLVEAPETPPSALLTSSGPMGDPANRVDFLIMGDGYTSAQTAKFNTDATNLISQFFSITPYAEYRNFVNVNILFTPSVQSGADHPPYSSSCAPGDNPICCSDPAMLQDPLAGQLVSTAFHGRYCAFQSHRLALVDYSPVLAAAAAVPDWDIILVLLNDPTYGGSGGGLLVSSTHVQIVDIARHEYGHSFSRLADEYDTAYPGFPPCSDISGFACEPNVTDQPTRAQVKWLPWIPPNVPVPTPEGNPNYLNVEGLFEGARYQVSGMYRHTDTNCLMNFLGKPFGAVCRQGYILRLYQGDWGSPPQGIRLIEPGSANPASSTVNVATSQLFSVGVLSPVGGAPSVQWLVDGNPVAGANGSSFLFTLPGPGTYQVAVKVRDATPLVNAAMAGTLVETTHEWTVVQAGLIFEDGFESSDSSNWGQTAPP